MSDVSDGEVGVVIAVGLVAFTGFTLIRAKVVAFGDDGGSLVRALARGDEVVPGYFGLLSWAAALSVPLMFLAWALPNLWYPLSLGVDHDVTCWRTNADIMCQTTTDGRLSPTRVVALLPNEPGSQRLVGLDHKIHGALIDVGARADFRLNVPSFNALQTKGGQTRLFGRYTARPPRGPLIPWGPLLLLVPWLAASLLRASDLRGVAGLEGAGSGGAVPVPLLLGPPPQRPSPPTRPLGGITCESRWAPFSRPLSVLLVIAPLLLIGLAPDVYVSERLAWGRVAGIAGFADAVFAIVTFAGVTVPILAMWAKATLDRRAGIFITRVTSTTLAEGGLGEVLTWTRVSGAPARRVELHRRRTTTRGDELEVIDDVLAQGGDHGTVPLAIGGDRKGLTLHVVFFDDSVGKVRCWT
jgi:hypothetical protein